MGKADFWRHGDWNAICDRCGFKYKASQLEKEWTGLIVCKDCFEYQSPQEFVRPTVDKQRVPWARPDKTTQLYETTLNGAVVVDAVSIIVDDASGAAQYTPIAVETDKVVQDASGITGDNVTTAGRVWHHTTIASVAGTTLTLDTGMIYAAADGLRVFIMKGQEGFLDTNEVTVASLG